MATGDYTKAKQISYETKKKVWERQKGKSIFPPYLPITIEMCCCHYIGKGCGGIGYEWNIFGCYQTTWKNEHMLYDQSKKIGNLEHKECEVVIRNHMRLNYCGWSEENCHYKKGKEEKEYGVNRRTTNQITTT